MNTTGKTHNDYWCSHLDKDVFEFGYSVMANGKTIYTDNIVIPENAVLGFRDMINQMIEPLESKLMEKRIG